jgi:hypothetical protein
MIPLSRASCRKVKRGFWFFAAGVGVGSVRGVEGQGGYAAGSSFFIAGHDRDFKPRFGPAAGSFCLRARYDRIWWSQVSAFTPVSRSKWAGFVIAIVTVSPGWPMSAAWPGRTASASKASGDDVGMRDCHTIAQNSAARRLRPSCGPSTSRTTSSSALPSARAINWQKGEKDRQCSRLMTQNSCRPASSPVGSRRQMSLPNSCIALKLN